jgi:hypothetical protein
MPRRRSAPHTLEENIAAEKAKLEAQIAKLKPGPQMDALRKKNPAARDRIADERVAIVSRIADPDIGDEPRRPEPPRTDQSRRSTAAKNMAHGISPRRAFNLEVAGIATLILSVALIAYVLIAIWTTS